MKKRSSTTMQSKSASSAPASLPSSSSSSSPLKASESKTQSNHNSQTESQDTTFGMQAVVSWTQDIETDKPMDAHTILAVTHAEVKLVRNKKEQDAALRTMLASHFLNLVIDFSLADEWLEENGYADLVDANERIVQKKATLERLVEVVTALRQETMSGSESIVRAVFWTCVPIRRVATQIYEIPTEDAFAYVGIQPLQGSNWIDQPDQCVTVVVGANRDAYQLAAIPYLMERVEYILKHPSQKQQVRTITPIFGTIEKDGTLKWSSSMYSVFRRDQEANYNSLKQLVESWNKHSNDLNNYMAYLQEMEVYVYDNTHTGVVFDTDDEDKDTNTDDGTKMIRTDDESEGEEKEEGEIDAEEEGTEEGEIQEEEKEEGEISGEEEEEEEEPSRKRRRYNH
jgi:hypothetical protein